MGRWWIREEDEKGDGGGWVCFKEFMDGPFFGEFSMDGFLSFLCFRDRGMKKRVFLAQTVHLLSCGTKQWVLLVLH